MRAVCLRRVRDAFTASQLCEALGRCATRPYAMPRTRIAEMRSGVRACTELRPEGFACALVSVTSSGVVYELISA